MTVSHPMEKGHYISFIAYATSDALDLVKLYPEQGMQVRKIDRTRHLEEEYEFGKVIYKD